MSSHNVPPDTAHHYRQEMIERMIDALNESGPGDDRVLLNVAATCLNLVRYPEEELQALLDGLKTDEEATEAVLRLYN